MSVVELWDLQSDYVQHYGAALFCVIWKTTSQIFSILSGLWQWWWYCVKNVFQREQSLFGPCQHSFCAPTSQCIFLEKLHYQIQRSIGQQCLAIWGWGQQGCLEWQSCTHPPLWYVPRIYRRPAFSDYIWLRNNKWWELMKPQDLVIMEILISFSWQQGFEQDPDTRRA